MAGLLRFSRKDAVALLLTRSGVETVIAQTRAANLIQLALAALLVAICALVGASTGRPVSGLFYGMAALAMWAVLATALSAWDHFRTAAPLRKLSPADLARETDPARFWRAHRGLFPWVAGDKT